MSKFFKRIIIALVYDIVRDEMQVIMDRKNEQLWQAVSERLHMANSISNAVDEKIKSEAFLDEIIERIKRKQL